VVELGGECKGRQIEGEVAFQAGGQLRCEGRSGAEGWPLGVVLGSGEWESPGVMMGGL
jgi:hypothetical protein